MAEVNAVGDYIRGTMSCDSGDADVVRILKFAVQLAYVLPFGALYASFMATILRKRKARKMFDDSFFTLCLVDGAVTLLFLLLDISFVRMTSYIRPACEYFVPLLKDLAYYLTPYYTAYMYAQFAKMLSTLTMAINRYTSVNYPVLHKTVWVEHTSKAIAAILLIPLLFVWPVAIARTSFVALNGQGAIVYEHRFSWARTTFGRLLIGGSTLVFTVFSGIVTTSKLSKLGTHMRKVEVPMHIATVFVSIGFVLVLILQVSYLVFDMETVTTNPGIVMIVLALTQVCNDFYMLSGPVVLLILDKRIRTSIFCCLRRRVDSKKATEISVKPVTKTDTF